MLERLDLDGNNIIQIKDKSFLNLSNLISLSLDNNQIEEFNEFTFFGLSNLVKLNLANSLKLLDESGVGELMNLESNNFLFIYPSMFKSLSLSKII